MQPRGVDVDPGKVDEILGLHASDPSSLIMVLQDIQREYSYLPMEALRQVGAGLGVSLAKIHAVATFYKAFSLVPKGENTLRVCLGTACHLKGGQRMVEELERRLDITSGETTEDMRYTLSTVNCVGACALAPVVVVDEEYHANMTAKKLAKHLKTIDHEITDDTKEQGHA